MGRTAATGSYLSPQNAVHWLAEKAVWCRARNLRVDGIVMLFATSQPEFMALKAQRRALAWRTGCGICSVEQLDKIGKLLPSLAFTQR